MHIDSRNPVWFCLPRTLQRLQQLRATERLSMVQAGFNYTILLQSACFLEGALESGLEEMITSVPPANHPMYTELKNEVRLRIGRSTNPDKYNQLFKLVCGVALSDLEPVGNKWPSFLALFALRNVLAHGRAIRSTTVLSPKSDVPSESEFTGDYSRAYDYLKGRQLVPAQNNPLELDWFCLKDEIADHFAEFSLKFVREVGDSLSGKMKEAFQQATAMPDAGFV